MGAYLSGPKTDKDSIDESNEYLMVGASSMQGWRNSQEDAHNCILNYDTNTSFFAVYDGHGGAEVAVYCAEKLPHFLKELATYKASRLEKALRDAFLGFDRTLLEPAVIQVLKTLAGEKNIVDPDDSDAMEDEEDYEDLVELHEESNLPLSEVLEKYKEGFSVPVPLKRARESGGGANPKWFYMRGRRAAAVAADAANKRVMDPDAHPAGSSTSAAAAAAAANPITCDAGPSSSKASAFCKADTEEPEEDSTVSSSSSSASKSNNNNSNNNNNDTAVVSCESTEAEPSTTKSPIITANGSPVATVANSCISPDSSYVKESEQNGNVTSSEAKTTNKIDTVCTSNLGADKADEATVSGSNDTSENKHNGNVGSSSSPSATSPNSSGRRSAISSTSPEEKSPKKAAPGDDDSTDEDADYDAENSSAEEGDGRPIDYSSEEDVDDDDDEDEDEDDDYEEEEDDEESIFARERFCANMIEEPGKDSGCTAVVALLKGRDLYVANAGDSRCVICRNGKAIDMSLDHKPEDEEEASRIIKAGGRVTLDGRVNGGLNLSRALGDHAYKMNVELPAEEQMISALPDIKKLIIEPEDEFMVLACDGIWNYMSSEEVVEFVRVRMRDNSMTMSKICEELFDNCLAPNTMGDGTGCDNMTAVIVRFLPKLLDLPTKIKPEETEDVLIAKQAAAADDAEATLQKALKRCASPSSEAEYISATVANKTKRLKTDEEEAKSSSIDNIMQTNPSTDNACGQPTTSKMDIDTTTNAISTTATAVPIANNVAELKECDSVTASSEIATSALSST